MNDQPNHQMEPEEEPVQPKREVDQFELENYLRQVRAEQNLGLGIVGGLIGMAIGAALWAAITVATDYQLGLMAIGVGFLAGAGVRLLGKGFETSFGVVGGFLALAGCVIGNTLTIAIVLAQQFDVPFFSVLTNLDVPTIVELMTLTFSSIDLLFYGLAIYFGYRYAFRQISEQELARFVRPA